VDIKNLKSHDSGIAFIKSKNLNIILKPYNYFVDHDGWMAIFSRERDLCFNAFDITKDHSIDDGLYEYKKKNSDLKSFDWFTPRQFNDVDIFIPVSKAIRILYDFNIDSKS